MRILGIDPGSVVTGWGIITTQRGRLVHVASGCVRTNAKTPMEERLLAIHTGLLAAIDAHRPDSCAIEAIFRHKSSESALRLGQARGVALLAAAQRGLAPASYNPSTVKRSVGAHGRADKKAMTRMVGMLLNVPLDGPADIADALAIAITHSAHLRNQAMIR